SWLPCLWGMSAHEFDEWLAVCRLGHFYGQPALDAAGLPLNPYQPQNPDGFSRQEARLTEKLWCWPEAPEVPPPPAGQQLVQYVAAILKTIPGGPVPADQLIKRLPNFVFDTVQEAWHEAETAGQDLEKLERLHPQ